LGYGGAFLDVVDECETSWAKANAPGGNATGAMVSLVQYLADYAHAKDPNFKIWVNSSGAEDLMTNSVFVQTIDGAYEEELFYKDNGSPQSSADINYNLNLLDKLVVAGKPVVAIEYVAGAATVANVQAEAAAASIGSYVANPNLELDGVDTVGFATLPPPENPGVTITGTSSNDSLIGGVGNDSLNGGGGNDTLRGGPGADSMVGGTGNDVYFVNDPLDVVTEAAGQGADTVWASANYVLAAGTEIESLRVNSKTGLKLTGNGSSHLLVGNVGNDTLIGGGGSDSLAGGAGADSITGGAGNDTIAGGAGNDTLTGGSGNDVFQFLSGFGQDAITDFVPAPAGKQDLLDVSGLGITTATFVANVEITAGANGSTMITIGTNSIRLLNVGPANIDLTDFRLT
jgi:Ca2+-binding RTX toxin-like protein